VRVLDPGTHPGSTEIDRALSGGDQPASSPVERPAGEVGWETNPPRQHGYVVHRDHGSAQMQRQHVDRGVADQLGREHFTDGGPSPAAEPLCGYCSEPLVVGTRVGTTNKRYCSPGHKAMAAQQRRAEREQ
jgi:hypothetical protein